ncbi:MAG TPA: hypothetical protein VNT52_18800 [Acidimicrobiales bacterium]|nr:hypothetical protein [Acidimicrobiales bacterium]
MSGVRRGKQGGSTSGVVRRRDLRRRRSPSDKRCDDCYEAKVPMRLAASLCVACRARAAAS